MNMNREIHDFFCRIYKSMKLNNCESLNLTNLFIDELFELTDFWIRRFASKIVANGVSEKLRSSFLYSAEILQENF